MKPEDFRQVIAKPSHNAGTATNRKLFAELLQGVFDLYGRELSDMVAEIWWSALCGYDIAALRAAFSRHCVNPDTGVYAPKPADVVRMLEGSTLDGALAGWSKVERALRTLGPYKTVAFDDALIHRVIDDMGGWVLLGQVLEKELPFKAREFENRYRGYRMRGAIPEHPKALIGMHDAHNLRLGYAEQRTALVGDRSRAGAVLAGEAPAISLTRVEAQAAARPAPQLEPA